jgi:hypothetical protein
MGFLFSKSQPNNTKPNFTNLQIQSSATGLPIPICYGTNKMAGSLIWYGDFQTIATTTSQGGKGGGSSTSTTYTYQTSFMMALCEGPISNVGTVWQGQSVYANPAALGLGVLSGYSGQSWGWLATNHPAQYVDYSYTACIVGNNINLGNSASLPNYNYLVGALLCGTMADQGNNNDADIGYVLQDFLTNARYGCNFPAAFIDTTSMIGGSGTASVRAFARTWGLAYSPFVTSQEQASAILDRWMQLTFCAAVWTGSILRFVPYMPGSGYNPSGPWSFQPDATVVYSLTDADFVLSGSNDPVTCTRSDIADAYNVVRLEILDSSNNFQTLVVEQRDEGHINQYGLRIAPTVQAHEITNAGTAQIIAVLTLQRGLAVRNTYTFKLSWEYCTLDPMDILEITDSALGLYAAPVRITQIQEDDNCELTITAEEYAGELTAVTYPTQTNAPVIVTTNVAPASVNVPMIFEPPSAMVTTPEVWAAISGGTGGVADKYYGGCQVWVSTDDVNFSYIGQVLGQSRMGVLTATLPTYSGSAPDGAHTLSVDLSESAGTLQTVSSTDAAAGVTNCWIGGQTGECVSFQTATLTSASHYDLTSLYCGSGGTPVQSHAIGDHFCRLDSQIFKFGLPDGYVGKTLYFKFPAFNIWGNALQDISTVVTYTYDPNGNGQTIDDNWVWHNLRTGINVDCGTAGTTVVHSADAGTAGDGAVIGNVDLGTI